MKVIVTCGPGSEPLDEVRRFTNFSTGELGILLSRQLAENGFEVLCCRSTAVTFPEKPGRATILPFGTNLELKELFQELARQEEIGAVFHAAALCDFAVTALQDASGQDLRGAKISSRSGEITLKLKPVEKIITQLRAWFPESLLIGWKYELDGSRSDAVAKAERQLQESKTDACVLNGRAYGPGYGFYQKGKIIPSTTKEDLALFLTEWLEKATLPAFPGRG